MEGDAGGAVEGVEDGDLGEWVNLMDWGGRGERGVGCEIGKIPGW